MKGKQNVLSEVNMIMICYNLSRLISIYKVDELKNRLKCLDYLFPNKIKSILNLLKHYCTNKNSN